MPNHPNRRYSHAYVQRLADVLGKTVSQQELHEFAARIGLRREWFQPLSSPHYDLSKTKRAEAVRNGAIEVDRRGIVDVIRRRRPFWQAEMRSPPAKP